jgi:hypothetical protein
MTNTKQLQKRISEIGKAKREAMDAVEALLAEPRSTAAAIDAAQSEVDRLTAAWNRLIHEVRVREFESPTRFGTYRTRAGQRPLREQLLDILDELGVPSSPRVVSDYAFACLGVELPVGRFASIRRDEERSYKKDAQSKPAWIVPALNISGFVPITGLIASSVWSIERRLIGPRTLRVNHLITLLALLKRVENLSDREDAVRGLRALVLRFARNVPGAWRVGAESDFEDIRAATQAELSLIGPDDESERKLAAEKLSNYPPQRRIWGLMPMVVREAEVG